jgi:phosphate transport system substrate-binding protein
MSGNAPAPPPATPRVVRRKTGRGAIVAVVAIIVIVVAGAALAYEEHWFGGGPRSGSCGPITLQGDGAQFVAPLVGVWAQAYNAKTGNQVNYPAAGSGTGLTHFSESPPIIDFAITDDPLSAAERAAMPSQPLSLPIIGGSLAIVYNVPGLPSTLHLNLTGPTVADIYLGTITNWDDPAIASTNPGVTLPNTTITTVHRSGSAGTTYVLSDFLTQDSTTWASQVGKGISIQFPKAPAQTASSSNSALLSTVASTADTIGYSDLTDVLTLGSSSLGYAAIENPAGQFVVPTLQNTASAIADKTAGLTSLPSSTGDWYNVSMVNANGAGDYPVATFAYLYVYQATDKGYSPSLLKAQVVIQWIEWALSSGQTDASGTNLYYAALPAAIVSVDQAGVQTMTYNGAAVPSCT